MNCFNCVSVNFLSNIMSTKGSGKSKGTPASSSSSQGTKNKPGTSPGFPTTFMSLLNNLAKKEQDKKEAEEAFESALKKGEAAGDHDYIARLKRVKQNFDKNGSHENKTRLLNVAKENMQTKSNESGQPLQNMLSAVLKKKTGQTKDNSNIPKKRKEVDSPSAKPPSSKKPKTDNGSTSMAAKSKKEKRPSQKPNEASERRKDTKKTHSSDEESDEETDTLVTKKVLLKLEKCSKDLCSHFAAALQMDLVTADVAPSTEDTEETATEEEDRVLHHENTLRRQLNQPLLKEHDPSVTVARSVVQVPEIQGMSEAQSFIAHQLGELFVELRELRSDIDTVKRSLNSVCLAQVQEHQDLRFIRHTVGGQKLDNAARDVLRRCGQLLELKTNPHLKSVPFKSTVSIRDFFLSERCVTELSVYVLTYADFNNHFTGHLVQLCIDPHYREKVWWCDSSVE